MEGEGKPCLLVQHLLGVEVVNVESLCVVEAAAPNLIRPEGGGRRGERRVIWERREGEAEPLRVVEATAAHVLLDCAVLGEHSRLDCFPRARRRSDDAPPLLRGGRGRGGKGGEGGGKRGGGGRNKGGGGGKNGGRKGENRRRKEENRRSSGRYKTPTLNRRE